MDKKLQAHGIGHLQASWLLAVLEFYNRCNNNATVLSVAAGFSMSMPFMRGLLDRWRIKFQSYSREEYKSAVSTYTDKKYSKANREAGQALLHSWMSQVVNDIAKDRGLRPEQVHYLSAAVQFVNQCTILMSLHQLAYATYLRKLTDIAIAICYIKHLLVTRQALGLADC